MEWPRVELGKAAEIRGGATPRRNNPAYWGGRIPWLTPTDLPANGSGVTEVTSTENYITEEGLASCSASLLPPSTVLFSSRASIGKVGIAAVPLSTNQGFANLIPRRSVDSRFLAWCLHFHAEQIEGLAGSTTFKEVSKSSLQRFRIPLPPLSEQIRIVELLDQGNHLRRLRAEADATADRILPALFLKMFGAQDHSAQKARLDELVTIGGALVDPNIVDYLDLPHLGGENIEKGTGRIINVRSVRESQLRSGKFHFTERHVLYSKIRPYLNKVTFPRMRGLCSADIYPLLPRDKRIGPWFLTSLLRSDTFVAYGSRLSDRLRMPKLNQDQLGSYEIPIPDPRALREFELRAESLTVLDEKRGLAHRRVDDLFAGLIGRAFSGSLTASWRQVHRAQLLQEMKRQANDLPGA